jgi:hypothetical protein
MEKPKPNVGDFVSMPEGLIKIIFVGQGIVKLDGMPNDNEIKIADLQASPNVRADVWIIKHSTP